jgi:hypothetical protein
MNSKSLLVRCSAGVALALGARSASAQTAHWSRLPDLPAPVANNAVTSVLHDEGTTTIYSFMGITNPNSTATITSAAYKIIIPSDDAWTRIADVPQWKGHARIAANALTIAGRVYLLGGYTVNSDHTETTDPRLLRYEQDTDSWIELSRPPVEVDDTVALVYHDRYIILCSGWHGPSLNNTLAVQVYDTTADTWTRLNDMPGPATGLFGHAGGISADTILIADGTTTNGGYHISDKVLLGQITTNEQGTPINIQWNTAPGHPGKPMYRAAGASIDAGDGIIMLVGGTDNPYNIDGNGYDGNPSHPNAQVLFYINSAQEWVVVPSAGDHTQTMDHRALVPIGNDGASWAIVGGMTSPGEATSRAQLLRITLP